MYIFMCNTQFLQYFLNSFRYKYSWTEVRKLFKRTSLSLWFQLTL